MKQIDIAVSPVQLRKLRKGIKVRVKPPMEGCGFYSLVVEPSRYDAMTRTFRKGMGKEIALSPAELDANMAMEGEGIFGKKFDKFLSKVGIKKEVYDLGDKIKEPVKKAIKKILSQAPNAGAAALAGLATAVGQPQLAGVAGVAGRKLGEKAGKYLEKHSIGYIDDPEAYQKDPSKFADISGIGLKTAMKKESRDLKRMAVTKAMAAARGARADLGSPQFAGSGMYAGGKGLYAGASRGRGIGEMGHTRSVTGMNGGMVAMGHPALQSQPMGANFHRQFQSPPEFQKFHIGNGLYA